MATLLECETMAAVKAACRQYLKTNKVVRLNCLSDNEEVCIMVDAITYFYEINGGTRVYVMDGDNFGVKQTPSEILKMIEG